MSYLARARNAAILLALAAAAPLSAQTAPLKIAYVNTRNILEAAPGRPDAEALLQKEATLMQDKAKKMSDSLQAAIDEYKKVMPTLTQAQRDAREKALGQRQADMQQRAQDMETQMQNRQNELMAPILDQIKLVLEDVRVEGSYTFLFDVANASGIVAADKNLDISDRVIAKLRTMPAPKAGEKKDEKKDDKKPVPAAAGVKKPFN
jgi:outer membrane protein